MYIRQVIKELLKDFIFIFNQSCVVDYAIDYLIELYLYRQKNMMVDFYSYIKMYKYLIIFFFLSTNAIGKCKTISIKLNTMIRYY